MEKHRLIKKILVLVNSSEASFDAVRYAVLMAAEFSFEVHALFVVDTETLRRLAANKFLLPRSCDDFQQELENDGQKFLERAVEIGKKKDVPVHAHIKSGSVWSEAVTAVGELDAQILLIGATSSSDAEQSDVFSTTYKKIILNADCSVLVVKQKNLENILKNSSAEKARVSLASLLR